MELGKFKVYEELGRGSYGTVYRAYDTTLKIERAIKILHTALTADLSFIERFQCEAQVAARLEHSHIVPVYEIGEVDGYYYLVMKYMAGGSLKDRLEKGGRLPYETALEIVCQIGGALEKAHRAGLIHRDVKPGNILLEEDGTTRLADFGFAKAMQVASSVTLTATGGLAGTPAYMAPELWNDMEAGPATDLYSLACVFYEMLLGVALFSGKTPTGIMKKHVMERPHFPESWPQGVPTGVEGVLEKALAKEPGERYQTMGEFLDGLQQLEKERKKPEQETGEGEPAWKKCGNCGRIYDVSFSACPHCRLQEKSEKAEKKKPDVKEVPILAGKVEHKPKNNLVLVAVAGVVMLLLIWGIVLMKRGREGEGAPAGLLVTNTLTLTYPPEVTGTPQPSNTPATTNTPTITSTSTPCKGSTRISEKDGMLQVYVPAGEFEMGSTRGGSDEVPVHTVNLDGYWIDKYQVTNAMFAVFVSDSSYETDAEKEGWGWVYAGNRWVETQGANWQHPQGNGSSVDGIDDHPVVQISWNDAVAYCEWAGRRLSSEAEWEKAARGIDGREYPWGNKAPSGELLNFADSNININWADKSEDDGYERTAPVGSYPAGASPYGALDMAGNVWEWANDWYGDDYYSRSAANNPQGPANGDFRVLRGGSWSTYEYGVCSTFRRRHNPVSSYDNHGFRCASSVDENTPIEQSGITSTHQELSIDFSSSLGWMDQSNGHIVIDPVEEHLVFETTRSETRRFILPIDLPATGNLKLSYRFKMEDFNGNGAWIFGLVEKLGTTYPVPSINASGLFIRTSSYSGTNFLGVEAGYQDEEYWTLSREADIGYLDTWFSVIFEMDNSNWELNIFDEDNQNRGRLNGTLPELHSNYNYLMIFEDMRGVDAWESASGYVDDIFITID